MNETLIKVISVISAPIVAYIVAGIYYGLYRKINARIHRRWGPPLVQNFIDNVKLFSKEDAASHGMMFHLGPVIMAAGSVTSLMFIPFFNQGIWFQGFASHGNLILITYLMVIGPLGNALAIGVSGNPFGVMGIVRGLTRLMGLEVPFYIAIAILMVSAGSTSLLDIMEYQAVNGWNMFNFPLAFIVSMFAFVGFMGTSPFDVVGAPTEVYSGPQAEFGSKYLGLLMSQSMIFSFAKLVLWVNLFMGGAANLWELLAKTFALFLVNLFIGAVYPRLKLEQAVDLLWKVPVALGIVSILLHFYL